MNRLAAVLANLAFDFCGQTLRPLSTAQRSPQVALVVWIVEQTFRRLNAAQVKLELQGHRFGKASLLDACDDDVWKAERSAPGPKLKPFVVVESPY
jgi:hypothetical protein